MTALPAPRPERRSAPEPAPAAPRPRLLPAPSRRRMATIPFVMVVALVMAAGMVGLLVLTTALGNQAFAVDAKQAQAAVLADQLAALQAEVADARSVQNLAVAAQKLGMRPDPYGTQLVLPDGTVVGNAVAVTGAEVPSVRYLTPEQAQAQIEALARAEAERKAKLAAQAKQKAEAEKKAEEAAKKAEARKKAAQAAKKGERP